MVFSWFSGLQASVWGWFWSAALVGFLRGRIRGETVLSRGRVSNNVIDMQWDFEGFSSEIEVGFPLTFFIFPLLHT